MLEKMKQAARALSLARANRRSRLALESGRTLEAGARLITSDGEQWVVVLTYARTGSTLVMGLLNSLDGFCIRGENDGAVLGLQTWDQAMSQACANHQLVGTGPLHPFWGIDNYPQQASHELLRTLLLTCWIRPPASATHVGYKELRWPEGALGEHVAFLRQLMPGVKIILNCRNVQAVARSAAKIGNSTDEDWISSREQEIRAFAAADRDCYLLEYEKVTAGPDEMLKLAAWLGVSAERDKIQAALDTRYSI